MVPLSAFHSRVEPHVIGCPVPVMDQAILDASILFCDDSMVVRDLLDPITTTVDQVEYTLDNPDAERGISRIVNAWYDGSLLTPVARAEVHISEFPTGIPTHYATRSYGGAMQIRLYPAPNEAKTLSIEVVTRPVRGATTVEDELLDRWADVVVAGAVSRISSIAGQPYSDPMKAGQAGGIFIQGSRKARIEGGTGQVVTVRRVTQRPFA